jgi:hypothetical protein
VDNFIKIVDKNLFVANFIKNPNDTHKQSTDYQHLIHSLSTLFPLKIDSIKAKINQKSTQNGIHLLRLLIILTKK